MKNRIVVITGGASGMGLAVARELMAENTVISIDRNPLKIANLKSLPKIRSIPADITSDDERNGAIAAIEAEYGRIDILMNNAGVGGPFDFVGSEEGELAKRIKNEMAVNYEAPILLTKRALPLLQESKEPVVIITTTGLVYTPITEIGTYCASKAAAHVFTMSLRHQLAALGIRVVEVLPPSVDTALNFAKSAQKMPPEKFAKIFLSKLSKSEDVINVGQSAVLEKLSRLSPGMAFRMLNK